MTSNLMDLSGLDIFSTLCIWMKDEVLYRVRARSKVPNWLLTCNKLLTEEWPMF